MGQKLIKATIYTTTQGAEILSAVLPAFGIGGLCVEDPSDLDFIIASKGKLIWDFVDFPQENEKEIEKGEVRVSFWLPVDSEKVLQDVREALLKLKSGEQYGVYGEDADFGRLWMHTEADDNDWIEKYRDGFRSFSPCEGFVVVPPWEEDPHMEEDPVTRIIIDPGMAFGTGSHETTAMCLSKIKALTKPGSVVLDVGAGSGILSIAAVLLGAESVYAVEIDEDAAASAKGNIANNGAGDRIHLITGDITEPGILPENRRFDLIVANLSCSLIEKILPSLSDILKESGSAGGGLTSEGKIILSGLLDTQKDRALQAVSKAGLKTIDICKNGEWITLEARR